MLRARAGLSGLAVAVLTAAAAADTLNTYSIWPENCGIRIYLRVEGVDPFTGRRTAVFEGVPLGGRADVKSPRAGFADFPRREIHLYASEADWRARKPALTVYYLGVPDTTPEFTPEAALHAYLAGTQPRGR